MSYLGRGGIAVQSGTMIEEWNYYLESPSRDQILDRSFSSSLPHAHRSDILLEEYEIDTNR